jgi:hypothetical protein
MSYVSRTTPKAYFGSKHVNAIEDERDLKHRLTTLDIWKKRLAVELNQAKTFGKHVPPYILTQIDEEADKVVQTGQEVVKFLQGRQLEDGLRQFASLQEPFLRTLLTHYENTRQLELIEQHTFDSRKAQLESAMQELEPYLPKRLQ